MSDQVHLTDGACNPLAMELNDEIPSPINKCCTSVVTKSWMSASTAQSAKVYCIEISECHSPLQPSSPSAKSPGFSALTLDNTIHLLPSTVQRRQQLLTPDFDDLGEGRLALDIAPDYSPETPSRITGYISTIESPSEVITTDDDIPPHETRIKGQPGEPSSASKLYGKLFYYTTTWPVFTIIINMINWIFFMWGILAIIGWNNAAVSLIGPVSPPQDTFPFITINYWPSCTSARGNTWRLISSQFSHAGIQHIGGNTLAGFMYGGVLECTHPHHWVLVIIVYEMGCIFGCLGHSYLWPFEGLIGCSTGVYALIGCTISHVVLNKDVMTPAFHWALVLALFFQGVYDTVTYYFWYNPGIAYSGHCTAFFIGIFLGLAFGLFKKPRWKKALGLLGLSLFCVLSISLIVHFNEAWPPSMLRYNPTFHPYDRRNCCGELFTKVNSTFSLNQARETYFCTADNTIKNYHKY